MSSHHAKIRNKFRKRHHNSNEEDENSLIVFGYSSKLHKTENIFLLEMIFNQLPRL
uniref:Uncharacterized protein n=1 Tax=Meloidogyne incognita TaxID=6306 RepID=A0A914P3P7_MELIC